MESRDLVSMATGLETLNIAKKWLINFLYVNDFICCICR